MSWGMKMSKVINDMASAREATTEYGPDVDYAELDDETILVSIVCISFNHEKYIRAAIDSFLNQDVDFTYEIVLHDDCSRDDTRKIITEYKTRYPELITTVFEKRNAYNQGKSPLVIGISYARGKYIAVCDGDDYWISTNKLQKQVNYMESNPECTFLFSNGLFLDSETNKTGKRILPMNRRERNILNHADKLSVSDMAQIEFPPTASFVFRKRDFDRRPRYSKDVYSGDRYYQLVMTSFGYAHYFSEPMIAYRVNNSSSMMSKWRSNKRQMALTLRRHAALYEEIDKLTNYQYADILRALRDSRIYNALWLEGRQNEMRSRRFVEAAKELGLINLIKYIIKSYVIR